VQLQHEHEWLNEMNRQRIEIVRLAKKLHITTLSLAREGSPDELHAKVWSDLQAAYYEMKLQLELLDVAAYTKEPDGWYMKLRGWLKEIFAAITNNFKLTDTWNIPHPDTRAAIGELEDRLNPLTGLFALQVAITSDLALFRTKWTMATTERDPEEA